jgi:hypothetical protein
VKTLSSEVLVIRVGFECDLNSLDRFFWKNPAFQIIKIWPVAVELFHVDRQTDRQTCRQAGGLTDTTKLIVAFRNFANRSKDETDKCTKAHSVNKVKGNAEYK